MCYRLFVRRPGVDSPGAPLVSIGVIGIGAETFGPFPHIKMEKSRQLWEATFPQACIGTRKIIRFHIEESIAIRKTDARVNLDYFWWRGRFCGIEWKVARFWAPSRSPQP